MLFLRGPESRDAPWLTSLSHVGKLVAALGRSVGLNRSERGFPRHRARWRKENAAASFRPPLLNRQGVERTGNNRLPHCYQQYLHPRFRLVGREFQRRGSESLLTGELLVGRESIHDRSA